MNMTQYNNHQPAFAGGEDSTPQRWSFLDLFGQKKSFKTVHNVQEMKASPKGRQRSSQRSCRRHSMPETDGVKQAAAAVATQEHQQPHGFDNAPRCTPIPAHINRLDQSENESSIVSEVTLMTYSDEKLSVIKEECFQRIQQEQKIRGSQLTVEEKEQLLREVQLEIEMEQEQQFQTTPRVQLQDGNPLELYHATVQPTAFTKKQQPDLLKRLHALKNKTNCQSVQISFMTNAMANSSSSSIAEGMAQERNIISRPGIRSAKERRRTSLDSQVTTKRGNSQGSRIKEERRRSSLDCSFVTARGGILGASSAGEYSSGVRSKVTAVNPQEQHEDQPIDHQEDVTTEKILLQASQEDVLSHTDLSRLHLNQKDNIEQQDDVVTPSSSSSAKNKHAIHEIIELKMLVANQQATIDTLSSKLHNLELPANSTNQHNRHIHHQPSTLDQSQQQQRLRGLEVENQKLTSQLNKCREREIRLLQNEFAAASTKQEQQCVDKSLNGEREHWQQDLERINISLMNDNGELRRQLMDMKKLLVRANGKEGTDGNTAVTDTTSMAKRRMRSSATEITVDSTMFADSIATTL